MAAAALALSVTGASAQEGQEWNAWQGGATRAALEDVLDRYERAAESTAYSATLIAEARQEAARVRQRLERGDFRTGDRVFVRVEGQTELTDTFTVAADNVISLPQAGDVQLAGVLRSELESEVRTRVERVIRDPVVRTRSLMRVGVTGSVVRPGYYVLDSQMPLSDVFMAAGGPQGAAQLQEARIERGDQTLLGGEAMRQALAAGRTLDELGLREGDRIHVPEPENMLDSARDLAYIIPATIGIVGLLF